MKAPAIGDPERSKLDASLAHLREGASTLGKPVPALVRATRILDAMSSDVRPKGISELARSLALPKSTVHGLCRTLVELGLLLRVGPSQFAIGPHVLAWANAFQSQSDLTVEFTRIWDELKAFPRETVTLSVLSGTEVLYIACRNGANALGVSFRVGMRLPAAFTATGKAMLATMPDSHVRRIFSGAWPEPMSRRSVRSVKELVKELEGTRERGFSIDNGQTREGAYCFGAPVFDASGSIAVAGVAVALLAIDVNEERTAQAGKAIRTVAASLSRRLGAAPGRPFCSDGATSVIRRR